MLKKVFITDLNQLKRGDIVKHKSGHRSYIVTSNYGDRVTAVDTVDITNSFEWVKLVEDNKTEGLDNV